MLQITLEQLFQLALREHQSHHLPNAEKLYRQVLAQHPDHPPCLFNLGLVLIDLGRCTDALVPLRRVRQLMPQHPDPPFQIGSAHIALGQFDEAADAFKQALACDPRYGPALSNLALCLQDRGQIDESLAAHRQCVADHPDDPIFHGSLIFTLQYHPQTTPQDQLAEARRWNEKFAHPLMPPSPAFPNDRSPDRTLRVGYVSADFRHHASAYFIIPLFRHHDPRHVEITVYAEGPSDPDRFRQACPNIRTWRSTTGLSDSQLADIIRQDRIDILVDMKLHTSHNRLHTFARKPAPVQVTWLGYPGTTGMDAMDCRLTDPFLDPPGQHDDWYAERSIRLADTFWCYDPLLSDPLAVNPLPAREPGAVTFASMNGLRKFNDGILDLWAQLLSTLPQSRLLLLAPEGLARTLLRDKFAARGIAADRLLFVTRQSRLDYLRLYHRADISLDTFPYNGHTTNLDSLWMGVPVVTLVGTTVVGRAGFSHLMNLGGELPQLIAHTPQDYLRIAADLARDLPRLRNLRATLRPRMEQSPLMNAPKFARSMEAAFRTMWHHWCAT